MNQTENEIVGFSERTISPNDALSAAQESDLHRATRRDYAALFC